MRRRRAMVGTMLAGLALAGCQGGTMGSRRIAAKTEPSLAASDEGGTGDPVAKEHPQVASSAVDRHPLLYKPREIYNSSGKNKVVKVAGATLVGIPMGIAGEIRQIIVGQPSASRGY